VLEVIRKGAYSSLTEQVRQLLDSQKELRSETGNLVSALRDRPNVRGRWGRFSSAASSRCRMVEHCDFETQTPSPRGRPAAADLIVQLPGGKKVVVDAKMAGQRTSSPSSCEDDESA